MKGKDMELVRQFNSELASIYEIKPPVSKAKMAVITRIAVKGLKYYKHIVHSVEKFLQKCKNEYKIAGLYVLDSIIRQSRHQFGEDKDLFGPRFQKNLKMLFQHIYQCPPEDKPKVVRVLNLWQKNCIYTPEIISPLVDMASQSTKVLAAAIQRHKKARAAMEKTEIQDEGLENSFAGNFVPSTSFEEPLDASFGSGSGTKRTKVQMSQDDEIQVLKAQLEQQRKQQELLQQQLQMQIMATKQQSLQMQLQSQQMQNKLQEQIQHNVIPDSSRLPTASQPAPHSNLLTQIQELSQQLERDKNALSNLSSTETVDPAPVPTESLPDNQSQFLENFQQLIQTAKGMITKDPRQQNNNGNTIEGSPKHLQGPMDNFDEDGGNQDPRINNQQNNMNNQEQKHPRPPLPPGSHRGHGSYHDNDQPPQKKPLLDIEAEMMHQRAGPSHHHHQQEDDDAMQIDNDDDYLQEFYQPETRPSRENTDQRRSRWGPPSEPVRTEDRNVREDENREAERREAERREREEEEKIKEKKRRERNVMPPAMVERMTVASITVWVGRLPKGCHPDTLRNMFQVYGEIINIDFIEARGCGFVTMSCRSDADKALRYLKYKRVDGYDVKMAWGQPKGLQDYSKFWDESFGAAFIPWGLFKEHQLPSLLDGCIIDEDTLPPGMRVPSPEPPIAEGENNDITPQSSVPGQTAPTPPVFMNNLPQGMLPPPPPPGMLPPGFRGSLPPMNLSGVLPLGFRPPQLPMNVLQLQQQLNNQRLQRPPLSLGNVINNRPLLFGRPPLNQNIRQPTIGDIPFNQNVRQPLQRDLQLNPNIHQSTSKDIPFNQNVRSPSGNLPFNKGLLSPTGESSFNPMRFPVSQESGNDSNFRQPLNNQRTSFAPSGIPPQQGKSVESLSEWISEDIPNQGSNSSNIEPTERSAERNVPVNSNEFQSSEREYEQHRSRSDEKSRDDRDRRYNDRSDRDRGQDRDRRDRRDRDYKKDERVDRRDRDRNDRKDDYNRRGRDQRDRYERDRDSREVRDSKSRDSKNRDRFGRDDFSRSERGRRSENSGERNRSRDRDNSTKGKYEEHEDRKSPKHESKDEIEKEFKPAFQSTSSETIAKVNTNVDRSKFKAFSMGAFLERHDVSNESEEKEKSADLRKEQVNPIFIKEDSASAPEQSTHALLEENVSVQKKEAEDPTSEETENVNGNELYDPLEDTGDSEAKHALVSNESTEISQVVENADNAEVDQSNQNIEQSKGENEISVGIESNIDQAETAFDSDHDVVALDTQQKQVNLPIFPITDQSDAIFPEMGTDKKQQTTAYETLEDVEKDSAEVDDES